MNDNPTKDLRFNVEADTREETTLYGPITADFFNDQLLCLEDEVNGQAISLNVAEATALRDYLNKVLP